MEGEGSSTSLHARPGPLLGSSNVYAAERICEEMVDAAGHMVYLLHWQVAFAISYVAKMMRRSCAATYHSMQPRCTM